MVYHHEMGRINRCGHASIDCKYSRCVIYFENCESKLNTQFLFCAKTVLCTAFDTRLQRAVKIVVLSLGSALEPVRGSCRLRHLRSLLSHRHERL